jgi:hypothetical protein
MAFKVFLDGNGNPGSFKDADVYEFHQNGVLEIRTADGKRSYHAPHKWDVVSADDEHNPGQPGGKYDVMESIH